MGFILFLMLLLSGSTDHAIHISKSEINYDSQSQSVQVSIMLFIDDLETALEADGGDKVSLFTEHESKDAQDRLEDYINSHLQFSINGHLLEANYLGNEVTEDLAGLWSYIEVSNVAPNQLLTVTNSIFMEIYDDQKHVMVVSKDLKRIDHWIIADAPYTEEIRF